MAAHGGRFQAQGTDIDQRSHGGVSAPWNQEQAATKAEAGTLLSQLESSCSRAEREARQEAFQRARDRVAALDYNVELSGVPHIKSFYCKNAPHKNMRVDIEIIRGRAWVSDVVR